jgi:hypothetical protein
MHTANRYAPWKNANGAENLVSQAVLFQLLVIYRKLPGGEIFNNYTPNEGLVEGKFNVGPQSLTFE